MYHLARPATPLCQPQQGALREREQQLRTMTQEMDALQFQNNQLTKRVEVFQQESGGGKSSGGSKKKKNAAIEEALALQVRWRLFAAPLQLHPRHSRGPHRLPLGVGFVLTLSSRGCLSLSSSPPAPAPGASL